MNNSNITLLLTACINPNGMAFTVLQNPDTRMRQYVGALQWYLKNTPYKIVFVENTNTYIGAAFQEYIENGRLEFVTFEGNNYPRELGKGYGEALIIREALSRSELLAHCERVVKVTGRLVVRNIVSLVNEASEDDIFASTCARTGNICRSFFFVSPKSFLADYFLPRQSAINDSANIFFEHVLHDALVCWIKDGNRFHHFFRMVQVVGKSGSTGRDYYTFTLKSVFRNALKSFYINVTKREKYIFGMR